MVKRRNRTKRTFRLHRRLHVERLRERCVLAAITGEIFEDANLSLKQEPQESGLAERLVFVDLNQNTKLDSAEPIALSDASGAFRIEGMEPGDYTVRLYSGGSNQTQTLPVAANQQHLSSNDGNATQVLASQGHWYSLNPNLPQIEFGNFLENQPQTVELDGTPKAFEVTPDGKLLILGSQNGDAASWILNPSSGELRSIASGIEDDLDHWTAVTMDPNGKGLAVSQNQQMASLYRLEYSDFGELEALPTTMQIERGTVAFSSDIGGRDLLVQPQGDSFGFSLWSQALGQPITASTHLISDVSEILGYSDGAGLLITRSETQEVSVFDVDANFALLNQFSELDGPAAFDASYGRLATFNAEQNLLQLRDVVQGNVFASFAVDLSGLGALRDLVWHDTQSLICVGDNAVQEISLRNALPFSLTIAADVEPEELFFATRLEQENLVPEVVGDLRWSIKEDTSLILGSQELMSKVTDLNGDQLVVLQRTQSQHGVTTVSFDGVIHYQPDEHFFGTDFVQIQIHDGASLSDLMTLEFIVEPVSDPPSGIVGSLADLHGNLTPGATVGVLTVLDPDNQEEAFPKDQHQLLVSDSRFEMRGNHLVFVGGDLDFATEPTVELDVTAFDAASNSSVTSSVLMRVRDPAAPQLSIHPDQVSVEENSADTLLTTLGVHDPLYQGVHHFAVEDTRFRIDGDKLFIQPDAVLDFEVEPQIVLVVTATREDGENTSVRETLLIDLINVPEQPTHLYLTNQTIKENVFGDVVGNLLVDGGSLGSDYRVTVDDSRFEVVGDVLKLIDQEMVERDRQTEIEMVITVSDVGNLFEPLSAAFVIQVAENANPYHNTDNPYDVDRNGSVTAVDALAIINYLNIYGPGPIRRVEADYAYDVNADEHVTSLDVLLVLNEINRQRLRGEAVGNGEQIQVDEREAKPEVSRADEALSTEADSSDLKRQDLPLSDGDAISDLADGPNWSEQAVDQSLRSFGDSEGNGGSNGLGSDSLVDLEYQSVAESLRLLSEDQDSSID